MTLSEVRRALYAVDLLLKSLLSSFTKVIILHTKILGLFSALTLHCSALLLNIIDERKLDGRDT